jgi:hypothetical protein
VRRVAALPIEHLLAAHPYLPFPDSHVQPAAEVQRYLRECQRFVDGMDEEILTALRAEGAPATAAALGARICAGRGLARPAQLTAAILQGYLGRLEAAGRVRRAGDGPEARWSVDGGPR